LREFFRDVATLRRLSTGRRRAAEAE
jgi:hypothetical protein